MIRGSYHFFMSKQQMWNEYILYITWKNREKVEKTSIAFKKCTIYNRGRGEVNENPYLSRRKITEERIEK